MIEELYGILLHNKAMSRRKKSSSKASSTKVRSRAQRAARRAAKPTPSNVLNIGTREPKAKRGGSVKAHTRRAKATIEKEREEASINPERESLEEKRIKNPDTLFIVDDSIEVIGSQDKDKDDLRLKRPFRVNANSREIALLKKLPTAKREECNILLSVMERDFNIRPLSLFDGSKNVERFVLHAHDAKRKQTVSFSMVNRKEAIHIAKISKQLVTQARLEMSHPEYVERGGGRIIRTLQPRQGLGGSTHILVPSEDYVGFTLQQTLDNIHSRMQASASNKSVTASGLRRLKHTYNVLLEDGLRAIQQLNAARVAHNAISTHTFVWNKDQTALFLDNFRHATNLDDFDVSHRGKTPSYLARFSSLAADGGLQFAWAGQKLVAADDGDDGEKKTLVSRKPLDPIMLAASALQRVCTQYVEAVNCKDAELERKLRAYAAKTSTVTDDNLRMQAIHLLIKFQDAKDLKDAKGVQERIKEIAKAMIVRDVVVKHKNTTEAKVRVALERELKEPKKYTATNTLYKNKLQMATRVRWGIWYDHKLVHVRRAATLAAHREVLLNLNPALFLVALRELIPKPGDKKPSGGIQTLTATEERSEFLRESLRTLKREHDVEKRMISVLGMLSARGVKASAEDKTKVIGEFNKGLGLISDIKPKTTADTKDLKGYGVYETPATKGLRLTEEIGKNENLKSVEALEWKFLWELHQTHGNTDGPKNVPSHVDDLESLMFVLWASCSGGLLPWDLNPHMTHYSSESKSGAVGVRDGGDGFQKHRVNMKASIGMLAVTPLQKRIAQNIQYVRRHKKPHPKLITMLRW